MRVDHGHMGLSEIASLLNVSKPRAHEIIRTYADFPAPAAILKGGHIWHADDVKKWQAQHPVRTPGSRGTKTTGRNHG